MLYNPPTGAATANEPYVGKNTAAGTQGSKIPPAAIEFTQREIVAVEVEAGIPPTNTDLKQMMRAIRSGRLNTYQDVGTPNALIATSLTAHTSYVPGLPLVIKLANDITGATTINLDSLGVLPVTFPGGAPLQRFDFLAGDLLYGRINSAGTGLIVISPINGALIDGALTKSVHGTGAAFPDLNAAFAWLARRRIASTGSVTFQLAAGVGANKIVYTQNIIFSHPDGLRVSVLGQPLGGVLPPGTSLTFTGTGTAQRAADTATNLTLLRNVYSTEIAFQGGVGFAGQGNIGNIQDLLLTSDGTLGDNLRWSLGSALFTRITSVGAGFRGIAAATAYVTLAGTCYALGSLGSGATAEFGGTLTFANGSALIAMSCAATGILAATGGTAGPGVGSTAQVYARGNYDGCAAANCGSFVASIGSVSRDNVQCGFFANFMGNMTAVGTAASGNGTAGYIANCGSFVEASNSSGSNTGSGYYAVSGSQINRQGGTATGANGAASPAVGVVGNNNAYIS